MLVTYRKSISVYHKLSAMDAFGADISLQEKFVHFALHLIGLFVFKVQIQRGLATIKRVTAPMKPDRMK